jgi:hypothetical protein
MPSTGVFRTSTMCLRTPPSTRGKDSSGGGTATRTRGSLCAPRTCTFCPPVTASDCKSRWPARHGAWWVRGPAELCAINPCTVSGGGKSEISKSIADAVLKGPVFVKDYHGDMEQVAEILEKDFSGIYRQRPSDERSRRPILSPARSLGSVIQLLTPSAEYTDRHNAWARQLSQTRTPTGLHRETVLPARLGR